VSRPWQRGASSSPIHGVVGGGSGEREVTRVAPMRHDRTRSASVGLALEIRQFLAFLESHERECFFGPWWPGWRAGQQHKQVELQPRGAAELLGRVGKRALGVLG
jgi:hypothetical protein